MSQEAEPRESGADVRRPKVAELARSAICTARMATVRVVCSPVGARLAIASVESSAAGELAIRLDAASPMAALLADGYTTTVTIAAPAPYSSLVAVGRARRESADGGPMSFTFEIAGLILQGVRGQTNVDLEEFWRVDDDPLAAHAERMLEHLGDAHAEELTACVRAHVEPSAEWVVPRTLDRFGLGLAVMTSDGVSDVVLGFPNAPVASIREVATYLRVALTCPCQSDRRHMPDA